MIRSQKKFQPNQSILKPPQFPPKFGSDPFKGEQKFVPIYVFKYSNRPAWTHDFNAKIGFKKFVPSPKILPKKCTKSAFQTKPAKTTRQPFWAQPPEAILDFVGSERPRRSALRADI